MQMRAFDLMFEWFKDRIEGKGNLKVDLSQEERELIRRINYSFMFLLRHEHKDYYKNSQQIKDCFEKNLFLTNSYHEGTNIYNNTVNSNSKLRALKDGEWFEDNMFDNKEKPIKEKSVYQKNGHVLNEYVRLEFLHEVEARIKYNEISIRDFNMLQKISKMSPHVKQVAADSILIDKHGIKEIFGKDDEEEVLVQKTGSVAIVGSKPKKLKNFFQDGSYLLYNEKGEIVDKSQVNYGRIIKKIRNAIAHGNIRKMMLDNIQNVVIVKIEKGLSLVLSEYWYFLLLHSRVVEEIDEFGFVYMPKLKNTIANQEEFKEFLSAAKLVKIKMNNCKVNKEAVSNYVKEKLEVYRKDDKIKDTVEIFIAKMLNKYYDDVSVEAEPLKMIPNLEVYLTSLMVKKKLETMDAKQACEMQDNYLMQLLNEYYCDEDFKGNSVKGSNTFKNNKSAQIINTLFQEFYSKALNGSKKLERRVGAEVEDLLALCQFSIFRNLIYNNFHDVLKQIKTQKVADLDYYGTEGGKLRTAINGLDMSDVEIINKKSSVAPRKAETLKDKIFALRIIRNSICHDGFEYQLSKTNKVEDTYLCLSSLKNNHLMVRVRVKDLLKLLDNKFFKEQEKEEIENVKLSSFEEVKKVAAKLAAEADDEDDEE